MGILKMAKLYAIAINKETSLDVRSKAILTLIRNGISKEVFKFK